MNLPVMVLFPRVVDIEVGVPEPGFPFLGKGCALPKSHL